MPWVTPRVVLAELEIADDLVELITDPRHGRAREMLCDALTRTKDSRAPDVLIELIDDDDVAAHAILALRRHGPKSSLPHLRRARSSLMPFSSGRPRACSRGVRRTGRSSVSETCRPVCKTRVHVGRKASHCDRVLGDAALSRLWVVDGGARCSNPPCASSSPSSCAQPGLPGRSARAVRSTS
jgi:hypothetical protein